MKKRSSSSTKFKISQNVVEVGKLCLLSHSKLLKAENFWISYTARVLIGLIYNDRCKNFFRELSFVGFNDKPCSDAQTSKFPPPPTTLPYFHPE